MKTRIWFVFVLICLLGGFSASGMAGEKGSARDISVDAALIPAGGLVGVLPPTAGQGAAAPVTGIAQGQFVDPALPSLGKLRGLVTQDQKDGRGRVYRVQGQARIAKQNVHGWQEVKEGMTVEAGHSILTQKQSFVAVTYDEEYLNITHIPENTKAVFRSIEPLDVELQDGTVFNIFDSLPKRSEWKVTTPTAVIAVRGTHWLVQYTASNGEIVTATFNVPDDGHASAVELLDILQNGQAGDSVDIPEGQQIELGAGQTPDPSLLKSIDPKWLAEIQEILEDLAQRRKKGQSGPQDNPPLPPTSGEFFDPGVIDPAGPGVVGGDREAGLDPQLDTNAAGEEPPPSLDSEESPSDEGPSEEPPQEEPGEGEGEEEYCPEGECYIYPGNDE